MVLTSEELRELGEEIRREIGLSPSGVDIIFYPDVDPYEKYELEYR